MKNLILRLESVGSDICTEAAITLKKAMKDVERLTWLDRDDVTIRCTTDSFGDALVTIDGPNRKFWAGPNIRATIDDAMESKK